MNVTGRKISATERSYDEWQSEDGKTRPAGVTRRLYLHVGDDAQPMELRVKDVAVFQSLAAVPFGSDVTVRIGMTARGNATGVEGVVDVKPSKAA